MHARTSRLRSSLVAPPRSFLPGAARGARRGNTAGASQTWQLQGPGSGTVETHCDRDNRATLRIYLAGSFSTNIHLESSNTFARSNAV